MKIKHLFLAALSAFIVSCTTDIKEDPFFDSMPVPAITAQIEQNAATKTYVDISDAPQILWHEGDQISAFVITNRRGNADYNDSYTFNGLTGNASGDFSADAVSSDSYYKDPGFAIYPYSAGNALTDDGFALTFPSIQNYEGNTFARNCVPMVSEAERVLLPDGSYTYDFYFYPVSGYLRVKLWSAQSTILKRIVLTANNGVKISGPAEVSTLYGSNDEIEGFSVMMDSDATSSITLDCTTGTLLGSSPESATVFWFAIPPVELTDGFTIQAYDFDGNVFEQSTSTSRTIQRNTISTMKPLEAVFNPPFDAVDLGLSVKWASFNVGTFDQYEAGNHFAWGETASKSVFSWAEYSYGTASALTKYNTLTERGSVDGKIILDSSDDVALSSWGEGWRVPTQAEWNELMTSCTWTWDNAHNGYTISRNGASIFLPAAGSIDGNNLTGLGTDGFYMSSTLADGTDEHSWTLHFTSSSKAEYATDIRYRGVSVRPVYSDNVTSGVTGISLNKSSLSLEVGASEALTASVAAPNTCINKYVEWTSSNPSVVTVSRDGMVRAVSVGSATITARTSFGGFTATCTVSVSEPVYVDLSASATANCYVVPSSGRYMFRATRGNTSTSVGAVASVEVLWESFGTTSKPKVGDVVFNASYYNDYIRFASTGTAGNAVIAAKDASGNILWSWHLWCTSANLSAAEQTYKNGAGVMMDRNLGALNAVAGNAQSIGLMYQWGRKDPFLGAASTNSNTRAVSTNTWPAAVERSSSTGNVAYAIEHPTTFIKNSDDGSDWMTVGSTTLWSGTSKTVYDPCPAGYRMPAGGPTGIWYAAYGMSRSYGVTNGIWGSSNAVNFNYLFGSGASYQANGVLNNAGNLSYVGDAGYYSSGTFATSTDVFGMSFMPSSVSGSCLYYVYSSLPKCFGMGVRCMKE